MLPYIHWCVLLLSPGMDGCPVSPSGNAHPPPTRHTRAFPHLQELRSWIAEAVALAEQQLGQQLGGGGRQQGGQDPKQQLEAG